MADYSELEAAARALSEAFADFAAAVGRAAAADALEAYSRAAEDRMSRTPQSATQTEFSSLSDVLSTKQAAEDLGVSRNTIYRLASTGHIPHVRLARTAAAS